MSAQRKAEAPFLEGPHTYLSITEKLSDIVLVRPIQPLWLFGLFISFGFAMLFVGTLAFLLAKGVGIWGINIPAAWGFAITDYVWWIEIGQGGTFISAFLLATRQKWRTSINRFAEAMMLFSVLCAALMPALHTGRPWYDYYTFPYWNTMRLWPQFRSALIWDAFAVPTYYLISILFFYMGIIPDLATFRDRAKRRWVSRIYAVLSLGWTGSAKAWNRYQKAYMILGCLCVPLVISVHSVVALDFTVTVESGWHSTLYPPYFIAGAIFSGFAMVLTLGIPLRKFYKLEQYITIRHLENCAKMLLVTGMMVTYSYGIEHFMAWYSRDPYESSVMAARSLTGHYVVGFWLYIVLVVGISMSYWSKKLRTNVTWLFISSILINIGMWIERFVVIVQPLSHDYLPSSWRIFWEWSTWDWAFLFGSIGLFLFLFLLFIRVFPPIAISESRELLHKRSEGEAA